MNEVALQAKPTLGTVSFASPEREQLSTVMVDASCFTLPYDYSLCDALGQRGCRVLLERSNFSAFEWAQEASSFQISNHFYRFSQRQGNGKVGRPSKLLKAGEHLFNMTEFVSRMRKLRPDVIHFQWLPVPVLDRLYLRQLGRIAPLVFTIHNTNQPRGTRIQSLYQKLGWGSLFQYVDAVVAHSEYSKRRILEQRWTAADKIHVVPHGVFDYYRSLDSTIAPAETNYRSILFFGAPERYKGLDVLLRAFALLPPELSDVKLVVAGRPTPDTPSLRVLSEELGIEGRVNWRLGPIRETEVPSIFRAATVVAIPYRYIDVSGVLMTALGLGKAVVANRTGGNPDIIKDGVHGRLVDPDSPESMARGLTDLLTNLGQLRSMEGDIDRLAMSEFSWTTSAEKTIEVYKSVLTRRTSPTR